MDETRGSSRIDPVHYKGDVVAQCWMDSRVIATLSIWLDERGMGTRWMSEVVRLSLENLCEHLVSEGVVSRVDDTGEARRLLERKYRVNLNPSGRGLKNASHNLALTSIRGDLGQMKRSRVSRDVPLEVKENEERIQRLVDEAMKVYEEEERKRIESSAVYDLEEMKRQGLIVEE